MVQAICSHRSPGIFQEGDPVAGLDNRQRYRSTQLQAPHEQLKTAMNQRRAEEVVPCLMSFINVSTFTLALPVLLVEAAGDSAVQLPSGFGGDSLLVGMKLQPSQLTRLSVKPAAHQVCQRGLACLSCYTVCTMEPESGTQLLSADASQLIPRGALLGISEGTAAPQGWI